MGFSLLPCQGLLLDAKRVRGDKNLAAEYAALSAQCLKYGVLCLNQNRLNDALGFFRRSLDIYEKQLPSDDPKIASVLYLIGRVYFRQKEFDDAADAYEKALVTYQKVYGEKHHETAKVIYRIGVNSAHQKNYQKAEEFMLKALKIKEELFNARGFKYIVALSSYRATRCGSGS
jgi:tetratricopeptide (TPR) repeat protein